MPIPTLAGSDVPAPRRYDPAHVVWFFSGITAGIMALVVLGDVTSANRGTWQLLAALVVAACFLGAAIVLLARGSWVPAGLLATAAVWVVPFAGQAFERLIGVWPDAGAIALGRHVQWAPFVLAVLTALAGLAVFAVFRFPFVFLTVTVSIVVGAELLSPLWSGSGGFLSDTEQFVPFFVSPAWTAVNTALVTGVLLVLVGVALDLRRRRDAAFWWHVVGLFSVAAALSALTGAGHTWAWIAMLVAGSVLLALSGPAGRATWATFGILGVYAAAIHFAVRWLDEWWEPFVLGIVSLCLLGLGFGLARSGARWSRAEASTETPPNEAPPPQPPSDLSAPASD